MREVTIRKVLNGLVITVGCQTLVFNSTDQFLGALRGYIADPEQTEKQWLEAYKVPAPPGPIAGAEYPQEAVAQQGVGTPLGYATRDLQVGEEFTVPMHWTREVKANPSGLRTR